MHPKRFFCTYFDMKFLPRGLALYESVEKNCSNFTFFILTFDQEAEAYLKALNKPNIVVIGINEFIEYFKIDVSKFIDKKQFYYSASPKICLYILKQFKEVDFLVYVDADVYFFNDVEILFKEIGNHSIAICPHRSSWLYNMVSTNYGIYNVGVNGFRNDSKALACIEDWNHDCESWYPNKPGYPLNYFSDQIFLDSWPQKFESLVIINHKGIDTAPWNIQNARIRNINGSWTVDNQPLVVFHFSALVKIADKTWNGNVSTYMVNLDKHKTALYKEYISKIESYNLENKKVELLTFKPSSLKMWMKYMLKSMLKETIEM